MKSNPEDALLARILPGLPGNPDLIVGPGDDCAAVRIPGARDLVLLKTDCVAEDVHFLRSHDPARVGWKALCRPLSDIAAMGGLPTHALVTIFSPPDLAPDYWTAFYRGLAKAARRFGVTIAGGELSRQPHGIAVSIALTGTVPKNQIVLRSGGQPGDLLFVTGKLGASLARHHLDFIPRIPEARWLASHSRPSAMMDLSDGLASDLPRLARASQCGFVVDYETLPLRKPAQIRNALSDGEDYELLFSLPPRLAQTLPALWKSEFPKVPLTQIGNLTLSGTPLDWPTGWDHFSEPPHS